MCCLFGESFSNNCIKPHFLSNYLDITVNLNYLLVLYCSSAQCYPFLFSFILRNCTTIIIIFSQKEPCTL